MDSPRLLAITNDFPPTVGGIENYEFSLLRRWDPSRVTVLTRWVPGCERFDRDLGFQVIREPVGTLLPTPSLWRKIGHIVTDKRIEAVHFPSSLPLGILGPRLKASRGLPYAVSVHGGEFMLSSKLPVVRSRLRSVMREASVVFPQSSFSGEIVSRFMKDHPPMVGVTCGVDLGRYKPPERRASGEATLISVSRLVARKGPATSIRALPLIHDKYPATRLVIVGGGPDLERLEGLAEKGGVTDSVTFTGPVPWNEVPDKLAEADIFVLPTRERFGGIETEGLPLAYVEAAAMGLPLIGGRAGGVADAVRDGETGFLVDGRNPEETAEAVIKLLDDPALRVKMGKQARSMVEQDFDWDSISTTFSDALHRYAGQSATT